MRSLLLGLAFAALLCGCNDSPQDKNKDGIADTVDSSGDTAEADVDIEQTAAGHQTDSATGDVDIGVGFRVAGDFPSIVLPYSEFCEVRVTDGQQTGSVTWQHHNGTSETLVDFFSSSDVAIHPLPPGNGQVVIIRLPEGWSLPTTEADVTCGFLETSGGTYVEDESEPVDIGDTSPVEDVLDEVIEALVPA